MPFDSSGFLVEKARVAVIHDWLYTYGGAERVLEQILAVFPNADVFSLFDTLPDDQRGFLGGRKVRTSFIQKLVRRNGNHRFLLPLMPLAIEQFDLSDYDLVISSSYAVAKGSSPARGSSMSATSTRRCATPGTCSTNTCGTRS